MIDGTAYFSELRMKEYKKFPYRHLFENANRNCGKTTYWLCKFLCYMLTDPDFKRKYDYRTKLMYD
jgi:hypothetical protein